VCGSHDCGGVADPWSEQWFALRGNGNACAEIESGWVPPGVLRKCVITKEIKVLYFDTLLQVFILLDLRSFMII